MTQAMTELLAKIAIEKMDTNTLIKAVYDYAYAQGEEEGYRSAAQDGYGYIEEEYDK